MSEIKKTIENDENQLNELNQLMRLNPVFNTYPYSITMSGIQKTIENDENQLKMAIGQKGVKMSVIHRILKEMMNKQIFDKTLTTKSIYDQNEENGQYQLNDYLWTINVLRIRRDEFNNITITMRQRIRKMWGGCLEKDNWYCKEYPEDMVDIYNDTLYTEGLQLDFTYRENTEVYGLKKKHPVLTLDMFFKRRNYEKGFGLYSLKYFTKIFYEVGLIDDKTIFELRTCNYAKRGIYRYYNKMGFKKYETVKELNGDILHHRLKCRFIKFKEINNLFQKH